MWKTLKSLFFGPDDGPAPGLPPEHLMKMVLEQDASAIEGARTKMAPELLRQLCAWYHTLDDWPTRLSLVNLIQDNAHPDMDGVMLDVLRAPGEGDEVDLPKAVALGYLDEELDNFMGYYRDRALLHGTVERFLVARGESIDGPGPVAEAETVAAPVVVGEPTDAALIAALMEADSAVALALIDAGADPNAVREGVGGGVGQPAIWWAASHGMTDVVAALITRGADLEAKDRWQATALHKAVSEGHTETARVLLEAGANACNVYHDGRTVLLMAIGGAEPELLALLLDAGADLHSPQPEFTPLASACFSGTTAEVQLLLDRGADPDVPIDYQRYRSATPLMLAAQSGQVRMVQALLKAGADASAVDEDGRTAADYAEGKRADRIREVLAGG